MERSTISYWRASSARRLTFVVTVGTLLFGLLVGFVPNASASPGASDDKRGNVYALTTDNQLLSFNQDRPGDIKSRVPVTGLQPGESLVGIDFRPATGRLYAIGSTSQVYVIDIRNGFVARIGVPFTPALSGTDFGVDFNPVVDLIRIVSNTGQNLRVNPNTGVVVGNDAALNYAAGDPNTGKQPSVVGAAYTNPDLDPNTATVLYDIDSSLDILTTQNPPNTGTLNTVGLLNVNTTNLVGFDIGAPNGRYGRNDNRSDDNPQALAVLQPSDGGAARLYRIDLDSGRGRERGRIGSGEQIRGLAIALDPGTNDQR